jgi:hypothetical protein
VPVACARIALTHGGRQVFVGPDALTQGGAHVGVVTVEEEVPELDITHGTGTQAGVAVIGHAVPAEHGGGGQARQVTPRGGAGRRLKCLW